MNWYLLYILHKHEYQFYASYYTLVKISDVNLLTTINYSSNMNFVFFFFFDFVSQMRDFEILLWYILYILSSGSRIQRSRKMIYMCVTKRNKAGRKKFIYKLHLNQPDMFHQLLFKNNSILCYKDCMKNKLSEMSWSCMAITLWWHYWALVLMTVNGLFPVGGYILLSRVFNLLFITLLIPVLHLGSHHKVLSQGTPLLFFLDFNLQLFLIK